LVLLSLKVIFEVVSGTTLIHTNIRIFLNRFAKVQIHT
jgi:hypothetical protein